jgi:hypothetical protein
MNIFQHLARAAAELLMQPDPYPDEYFSPEVTGTHKDECGRIVYEVKAMNYREVERLTEGLNVAGCQIVHIHTGMYQWEIHQEELEP